jgi:hypothetical protein
MTKPRNDSTALPSSARKVGRWLYPLIVAAQTVGATMIYWQGLPIYRGLSADVTAHDPQTKTLVWTTAASALIQVAYWTGYHTRLPPPRFANALLGHVQQLVLDSCNSPIQGETHSRSPARFAKVLECTGRNDRFNPALPEVYS